MQPELQNGTGTIKGTGTLTEIVIVTGVWT